MSQIWSAEKSALGIAALLLLIIGIFGGNWLIASLVTLGGYITWLYYRLLKLENWISRGTKASKVYDDDGFIGVIIRQLYRQKKIYTQRKRRTKEILRRLNRNISALPDATLLLNADFEIEWCNPPARYLLDIRTPQDIGYRITNLIRSPGFQQYLRSYETQDFIEIESPVDPLVTVQIKMVSIGGSQTLLIARNVSDQKQLRESLKNFVANASHELRSPLTVISGHLEMLEAEKGISATGKASLQTAQRQAARMRDLIQNLLLLSQVESYQLRPDEGERVAVSELMAATSAAMEKYPDRRRIEWDDPGDFYLLGIKAELESICINLVENALKYSSPDTPINVRWRQNSLDEYEFSVQNQGPGIDPDDLPRITERYYRGSLSAADLAGSGLGLAIVQQAAHKHGAVLHFESNPQESTIFNVTFPTYRCLGGSRETAEIIRLADF